MKWQLFLKLCHIRVISHLTKIQFLRQIFKKCVTFSMSLLPSGPSKKETNDVTFFKGKVMISVFPFDVITNVSSLCDKRPLHSRFLDDGRGFETICDYFGGDDTWEKQIKGLSVYLASNIIDTAMSNWMIWFFNVDLDFDDFGKPHHLFFFFFFWYQYYTHSNVQYISICIICHAREGSGRETETERKLGAKA